MDMNIDLLKEALFWMIGGGGSGVGSYFIVEKVKALKALAAEKKRWAALGISAGFAMAAYAACVGLNYLPDPVGWQGWLESLFAAGGVAAGIGQLVHGRAVLSKKS